MLEHRREDSSRLQPQPQPQEHIPIARPVPIRPGQPDRRRSSVASFADSILRGLNVNQDADEYPDAEDFAPLNERSAQQGFPFEGVDHDDGSHKSDSPSSILSRQVSSSSQSSVDSRPNNTASNAIPGIAGVLGGAVAGYAAYRTLHNSSNRARSGSRPPRAEAVPDGIPASWASGGTKGDNEYESEESRARRQSQFDEARRRHAHEGEAMRIFSPFRLGEPTRTTSTDGLAAGEDGRTWQGPFLPPPYPPSYPPSEAQPRPTAEYEANASRRRSSRSPIRTSFESDVDHRSHERHITGKTGGIPGAGSSNREPAISRNSASRVTARVVEEVVRRRSNAGRSSIEQDDARRPTRDSMLEGEYDGSHRREPVEAPDYILVETEHERPQRSGSSRRSVERDEGRHSQRHSTAKGGDDPQHRRSSRRESQSRTRWTFEDLVSAFLGSTHHGRRDDAGSHYDTRRHDHESRTRVSSREERSTERGRGRRRARISPDISDDENDKARGVSLRQSSQRRPASRDSQGSHHNHRSTSRELRDESSRTASSQSPEGRGRRRVWRPSEEARSRSRAWREFDEKLKSGIAKFKTVSFGGKTWIDPKSYDEGSMDCVSTLSHVAELRGWDGQKLKDPKNGRFWWTNLHQRSVLAECTKCRDPETKTSRSIFFMSKYARPIFVDGKQTSRLFTARSSLLTPWCDTCFASVPSARPSMPTSTAAQ